MRSKTYQLADPFDLKNIDIELDVNEDQFLIKTVYSTISPGTELSAYTGLEPLRPTSNAYPRLVGYCNVGVIEQVPSKEQNEYLVGDYVLTHKNHCSHFAANYSEIITRIGSNSEMTDDDLLAASTTYLFHLGYNVTLRTVIMSGMRVAIIGIGTLGLTVAATTSINGARIDGYSNNSRLNALTRAFGFDEILLKNYEDKLGGYDVTVLTTNSWSDWRLALKLTRPGGQIAVLGFPGRGEAPPKFNPLDSQYFYDKQLSIHSCGYTPNLDVAERDYRFSLKRNCGHLLSEILANRLPGRLLIDRVEYAENLESVYKNMVGDRRDGRTVCLDWRNV